MKTVLPRNRSRYSIPVGPIQQWYEAFVLLNILDLFLTVYLILDCGGVESNPLLAYLLQQYGWPAFVVFKFAQCILVVSIADYLYRRRPAAAWGVIGLGCGMYWLLMIHDIRLLVLT